MNNNIKFYRPIIRLTDAAVDWVEKEGKFIISKDFVGYTALITNDLAVAISIDKSITPFSLNPKKPLTIKKAKKVFKYLLDTDFIKDATYDPFPEMEKYNNMKFLVDEAALLNTYIMASSYELNNKNFTIDDEYGEGITDDMLQQLGITVESMEEEKA